MLECQKKKWGVSMKNNEKFRTEMLERWKSLCKKVGAEGDFDLVFSDLEKRYSEQGRHYHRLSHIRHCLLELDKIRFEDFMEQLNEEAIELAFWFHDAVYSTKNPEGSKENEKQSAKIMAETMRFQLTNTYHKEILLAFDLIKWTALHYYLSDGPKVNRYHTKCFEVVADIDLAILGQPRTKFDLYEEQIQQEFAHVPLEIFLKKRKEIILAFLQKPSIYHTEFFREKYEERAQENLRRSFARLVGRTPVKLDF